jgi:hypothetical protein
MARTTYVKAAQQRFATIPKLDENGVQIISPVLDRDGKPKTDKHGRKVVRRATVADKTRPLPNYTCDRCHQEIPVGAPYKWIKPKSGPYGGRLLTRCDLCPTWHVWDYSSSLSARTAQIAHEGREQIEQAEDAEGVSSALSEIAERVRELAEEKRESAANIEEGFGHSTSSSEELESIADDLEAWADDIEAADVPDYPDTEEGDCEECGGSGKVPNEEYDPEAESASEVEEEVDCEECEGTGQVTPDEPTEDQVDEWRSEVEDATSIIDECPV